MIVHKYEELSTGCELNRRSGRRCASDAPACGSSRTPSALSVWSIRLLSSVQLCSKWRADRSSIRSLDLPAQLCRIRRSLFTHSHSLPSQSPYYLSPSSRITGRIYLHQSAGRRTVRAPPLSECPGRACPEWTENCVSPSSTLATQQIVQSENNYRVIQLGHVHRQRLRKRRLRVSGVGHVVAPCDCCWLEWWPRRVSPASSPQRPQNSCSSLRYSPPQTQVSTLMQIVLHIIENNDN